MTLLVSSLDFPPWQMTGDAGCRVGVLGAGDTAKGDWRLSPGWHILQKRVTKQSMKSHGTDKGSWDPSNHSSVLVVMSKELGAELGGISWAEGTQEEGPFLKSIPSLKIVLRWLSLCLWNWEPEINTEKRSSTFKESHSALISRCNDQC